MVRLYVGLLNLTYLLERLVNLFLTSRVTTFGGECEHLMTVAVSEWRIGHHTPVFKLNGGEGWCWSVLACIWHHSYRRKMPRRPVGQNSSTFSQGESKIAFLDLDSVLANSFSSLKVEILSRSGLTEFRRAQRFHGWSFKKDQPPGTQMHQLIWLTKKW